MLRALKLSTGPDNASHITEGTVAPDRLTDVATASFHESPPHSSFDWHEAPQRQDVLTLSGTLEFTTRDGETFVLRPGDILVPADDAGSGHKWRLIDDDPWRRCYVVLKPGAPDLFAPARPPASGGGG
jgi:quercetin dioxygenase-like cupin family protein